MLALSIVKPNSEGTVPHINPQFITGFTDAEGSFAITINKRESGA
jgi:hypothetical protein